jgi:hypothetical protein
MAILTCMTYKRICGNEPKISKNLWDSHKYYLNISICTTPWQWRVSLIRAGLLITCIHLGVQINYEMFTWTLADPLCTCNSLYRRIYVVQSLYGWTQLAEITVLPWLILAKFLCKHNAFEWILHAPCDGCIFHTLQACQEALMLIIRPVPILWQLHWVTYTWMISWITLVQVFSVWTHINWLHVLSYIYSGLGDRHLTLSSLSCLFFKLMTLGCWSIRSETLYVEWGSKS